MTATVFDRIALRESLIHPATPPCTMRWWCLLGDVNGNVLLAPSGREQVLIFDLAAFSDPESVLLHVEAHYCRSADPRFKVIALKAWASDKDPGTLREAPKEWFTFGTSRMQAEIDAGLRPQSSILLPPLELSIDPETTPTRGKGLVPTR